jgi:hypothetical protein
MKNSILKTAALVVLATTIIFSCKKKSNPAPDEPASTTTTTGGTTGTPAMAGTFMWQENGGPVITTDTVYWTTGAWGTGMRVSKSVPYNYFEINWGTLTNNISVGAKTVSNINEFGFFKGADTYSVSTNQILNITASSTTTISGNFNMAVSGSGNITSITATFTGIPKQ